MLAGTVFGFLYLYFKFKRYGFKCSKKREHTSRRIYEIFSLAVPIVVGSLITQISGLVDVLTVHKGLSSMLLPDPQGDVEVYPGLSNGLINQGAADVPPYL